MSCLMCSVSCGDDTPNFPGYPISATCTLPVIPSPCPPFLAPDTITSATPKNCDQGCSRLPHCCPYMLTSGQGVLPKHLHIINEESLGRLLGSGFPILPQSSSTSGTKLPCSQLSSRRVGAFSTKSSAAALISRHSFVQHLLVFLEGLFQLLPLIATFFLPSRGGTICLLVFLARHLRNTLLTLGLLNTSIAAAAAHCALSPCKCSAPNSCSRQRP